MIETIPWDQFQPMEGVSLCVFPSAERYLHRTNDDIGDFEKQKYRQIPQHMLKDLEPCSEANEQAIDDETEADLLDPKKKAFESDKPFPPDECNLTREAMAHST